MKKIKKEEKAKLEQSIVSEIEANENIKLTKEEVIKLYEFILNISSEEMLKEHDQLKKQRETISEINDEWKRLSNISNGFLQAQCKISLIERQVKRKDKFYEIIGRN